MVKARFLARRKGSWAGTISAGLFYTPLAGAPLFFGSRDSLFVAGWCIVLGAGLILAPVRRLRSGHLLVLAVIAVLAVGFGIVIHEQLSDRPWIASFNPVWSEASRVLGQPLSPSVSIIKGEPWFTLGPPLANALALVLGLLVGTNPDRAMRAIHVLAWAGVCYAIYGFFALQLDPTHILWREKTAYVSDLTATFINRNTAGAYFGSCASVWLVLLLSSIRNTLPRAKVRWRKLPNQILTNANRELLLRFVMLWVCLGAMLMTSSRGGVLVSLMVMILACLIYFRRDLPRGKGLLIALAAGLGGSAFLLQILGSNVVGRIDLYGLSDAGRLSAYRSTLQIIADNPWFGTGLGTFAAAFPPYRSSAISLQSVWDIAHNTPLEFASEMGIPLALLVIAAWIAAFVVLARALRGRRRNMVVPLSSLAVSLIAVLHSMIDFSLQIPGYAIVTFAFLGVGLAHALRGTKEVAAAGDSHPQDSTRIEGAS